jgi:hypothetical protein
METLKLNNIGSAPRSSEGIYKAATTKGSALFTPNKSSASRLLDVPVAFATSAAQVESPAASSGISFWRYLIIFIILGFFCLTLFLFLIKPVDKDITQLYDPVTDLFKKYFKESNESKKGPIKASVSKKNNNAAVEKLDKLLTVKPVINNIDNTENKKINIQAQSLQPPKKYKRLPVIPEADDATSSVQMKPTSKTGFCYIGEDRGFRSCIEVGEGDVCMSGDIFPSESICINPNLRE